MYDEHYIKTFTYELKMGIFYFKERQNLNKMILFANVFYIFNKTNIDLIIKSSKKSNKFFFFKKHKMISSNSILDDQTSINGQSFIIKSSGNAP